MPLRVLVVVQLPPAIVLGLRASNAGIGSRADADHIRAEIAPGRRAVVVGMGFIGSEVAAWLQAGSTSPRSSPGERPLFRVLGDRVGRAIADLHAQHGIRTSFGQTVVRLEGTDTGGR